MKTEVTNTQEATVEQAASYSYLGSLGQSLYNAASYLNPWATATTTTTSSSATTVTTTTTPTAATTTTTPTAATTTTTPTIPTTAPTATAAAIPTATTAAAVVFNEVHQQQNSLTAEALAENTEVQASPAHAEQQGTPAKQYADRLALLTDQLADNARSYPSVAQTSVVEIARELINAPLKETNKAGIKAASVASGEAAAIFVNNKKNKHRKKH
jgi:hypothetical protein